MSNNKKIKDSIQKKSWEKTIDNYLEKDFYNLCKYEKNKKKENIVRITINIIGPVGKGSNNRVLKKNKYFGQILLMECYQDEIFNSNKLFKLYKIFKKYQKYVWDIDNFLQISMEFYSKNGKWENQPFLKTKTVEYCN